MITERDLQTLERCNRENIKSLERIVGVDRRGQEVHDAGKATERELRKAGDLWAEHILENAKAYIMSFIYIVVTVTIGYPLISGIAYAAGLREDSSPGDRLFYFLRFLDALVYFWIPQINIFIVSVSSFCYCSFVVEIILQYLSNILLCFAGNTLSFDSFKDATCAIVWWAAQ